MRQTLFDTFTVTERRKAKEICICDVCKKEIFRNSFKPDAKVSNGVSYWKVVTGHNDWGNDSPDSVESFDICSPDCLKVKVIEYIDKTDGLRNSQYLDIKHINGVVFHES